MNTVDIVLLVVLVRSLRRLAQRLRAFGVRLAGAVIAFFVARFASGFLADWLSGSCIRAQAPAFIAFVLIFLVIDRLINFIARLINKILKIVTFSAHHPRLNGLLGGVVGLAEGVVLVGSATYLVLI